MYYVFAIQEYCQCNNFTPLFAKLCDVIEINLNRTQVRSSQHRHWKNGERVTKQEAYTLYNTKLTQVTRFRVPESDNAFNY